MIYITRTKTVKHHRPNGTQIVDMYTEEKVVSAHEALMLLARDEGWERFDPDEREEVLRIYRVAGNFCVRFTGLIEDEIDWPSKRRMNGGVAGAPGPSIS